MSIVQFYWFSSVPGRGALLYLILDDNRDITFAGKPSGIQIGIGALAVILGSPVGKPLQPLLENHFPPAQVSIDPASVATAKTLAINVAHCPFLREETVSSFCFSEYIKEKAVFPDTR